MHLCLVSYPDRFIWRVRPRSFNSLCMADIHHVTMSFVTRNLPSAVRIFPLPNPISIVRLLRGCPIMPLFFSGLTVTRRGNLFHDWHFSISHGSIGCTSGPSRCTVAKQNAYLSKTCTLCSCVAQYITFMRCDLCGCPSYIFNNSLYGRC